MSAIAGIIRFDGHPVDRVILGHMQTVLTPYGNDTQNHWHQGTVALLRTLLRTTPEDSFDHQPLIDSASGTTLVFDGRIDNRDELVQALGLSATEASLMADSALVLRACLRWDTQAVDYLLGDFALACWQADRRRLWLARDPLGVRPLFWHQHPNFLAFATMPKALFTIPEIPKLLCEEHLHNYLCSTLLRGRKSFFKDIYRVEPGQVLMLEDEQIATYRYHSFDPHRKIHLSSDNDYLEAFGEHLDRAVACRLRSSGLIASELSSGLDSSTVTAIAARQLAERNTELLAYTAVPREGFSGPLPRGYHGNEGPAAAALAMQFTNVEHILIHPDNAALIDTLHQDIDSLDQPPFSPIAMAWTNAIRTDAVRRGAKVLLGAATGNVTISYNGLAYLPMLLGRGQWLTLWREMQMLKRLHPSRSWQQLLRQFLAPPIRATLQSAFGQPSRQTWTPTAYSPIHPAFATRLYTNDAPSESNYRLGADGRHDRAATLNRIDIGEYFAADNIGGLERRDPTADRRLSELCLAIPETQYWRDGQPSWLLRQLMGSVLPPEILQARTKGFQAADWFESVEQNLPRLRQELADLAAHDRIDDYLDLASLMQAAENWPESGWESSRVRQTYQLKLAWGLSVGIFIQRVLCK